MSYSNSFSKGGNGFREGSREELLQTLNHQLANTVGLRSHVRQAHWNLKGPYLEQVGLLLDGFRRELHQFSDLVAKRINAMGGHAIATVRVAASRSAIRDDPPALFDARDHLEALLSSYSRYERDTHKAIARVRALGDSDTVDLLLVISIAVEKNLWFLSAYLEAVAIGLHGGHLPQWTSAFGDQLGDIRNGHPTESERISDQRTRGSDASAGSRRAG